MKVAVVLGTFPKLSERFIARELAALSRGGLELHVFALKGGDPAVLAEEPFRSLAGRSRVLPHWLSLAAVRAKAAAAALRPLRLLRVIPDLARSLPADPRRTLAVALRLNWAPLLARQARRAGCNLIWAHWASLPGAVGLVAARLADLPFALSCHAWDVFVNRALVRAQLEAAGLVTACSRAAMVRLREIYGPAAGEVRLLHHGVHCPAGPPPPRLPRGGRPFRVLGVGRFVPKKGFRHLLEAAALGGFEVELMGEGPGRGELERLVAERGLAGRVTFAGLEDAAGMAGAFARCDAICAPSVVAPDGDRDGVPNVLLEASVAGLPAVASNVGGIPEFVEPGRTGLLVPPGDSRALAGALGRLEAEAGLAARLTRGARERIRAEFDLETGAAELAGLLRAAGSG